MTSTFSVVYVVLYGDFTMVIAKCRFMSLGKEQMWTMSHLEDTLLAAAEKLPPDQACKSHSHLYKLTNHFSSLQPSSLFDANINNVMIHLFSKVTLFNLEFMQKIANTTNKF